MATSNDFFFRGQNCILKVYQEGKNVYFAGKDWDVNENATEVADPVNGEKRDRLDKITNYFEANVNLYQSDQSVMQMLLDAQDVTDNAGLPLAQTASIIIEQRDGTKAAYMLRECVFGPWKTSASGRSDAVMLGFKIRFRWYTKI